jgi:hypothetical protein
MAARRDVALDRFGNVVDDGDGVLRDGQRLRVPVQWMDGATADADPYAISDAQRERVADAYAAFKDRLSRGMHRHRIAFDTEMADGEDRARAAYDAMKKRLGAPRARRQPKPVDPGWSTL